MVEQIERFGSELHGQPFGNEHLLLERRVDFIIPGSTSNVASQIPPHPNGRYRERRWIEPVVDRLMGRVYGNTGDEVRPLISCYAVRKVRRTPVHQYVNGAPARGRRNPAQFPTSQQLSRNTTGR